MNRKAQDLILSVLSTFFQSLLYITLSLSDRTFFFALISSVDSQTRNRTDVFQSWQKSLRIRVLIRDSINVFLKDTISSETFSIEIKRLSGCSRFFRARAGKTGLFVVSGIRSYRPFWRSHSSWNLKAGLGDTREPTGKGPVRFTSLK